MLKDLCEKGTKFVSRCCGLLLKDFRAIARSFDKSQKLIILLQNPNTACILKFSFKYLCTDAQQIKICHY